MTPDTTTDSPLDLKHHADGMLHDVEIGLSTARQLADAGIDRDGSEDREKLLHKLVWILDRVSEGLTAAAEFVQVHWPKPDTPGEA